VTRFQRLAVVTTAATFLLIAVGGLVRATDSGLGCPDWPRCFGKLTPPPNLHSWIEHSHRLVAAAVIVLVALTAVTAWRTRQPRSVRWATVGAVAMVLAQAVLGAIVVWAKLEAESVTLHLATALALVALLQFVAFRSRWPAGESGGRSGEARAGAPGGEAEPSVAPRWEPPRAGRSRRFVRLAMVGAGLTYAQMLVGSTVTGHDAGLAYPVNVLVPDLELSAAQLQLGHRALAMVVGLTVVAIYLRARRTQRAHPTVTRLAGYGAGLVVVQIALGVANVANRLSALTVVPHLVVGSLLWGTMFALVLHADRFAGTAARDPAEPEPAPARGARDSIVAYFQLTKPRIIELLLITTVPTMFLAKRGVPSPWLVATTLLGGSLSAASANVINCYLDRDIDAAMRRTRRRPLPTHQVAPLDALRFGLVLGVAGFVWLWATVNLLSAALATAAILFYVFVYTIGLKRRSTQNIVIGGAAGAGAVRDHLLLDAAPLLGAVAALPGGLRGGRGADAAGGPRPQGDQPPDPLLHPAAGLGHAADVPRRPHGDHLPGGRGRPRRRVRVARRRPVARRLRQAGRQAVQLLQPVPGAAVPRHGPGRGGARGQIGARRAKRAAQELGRAAAERPVERTWVMWTG
jgi:heme A synthase